MLQSIACILIGVLVGWTLVLPTVAASTHDFATAAVKTVDTRLGFSFDVPDFLVRGQANGNNKLILGSPDDDYAVVVAYMGPEQSDAAARDAVYRAAFARNGLEIATETDVTAAGRKFKRFVCTLATPKGNGHVEAVLVPVGSDVYSLMIVTPEMTYESRKASIARTFESIRVQ